MVGCLMWCRLEHKREHSYALRASLSHGQRVEREI